MAVGSSMLATIRTAPPQWTQVLTSMEKTRLSRCAYVIARRFSSGLRGASLAQTSTGAASIATACPAPTVSAARAGRRSGRIRRGTGSDARGVAVPAPPALR